MKTHETISHTFEPIYNEESRVLILGTFPSVKSRENQFYYGHPQNRFWKVLAAVTGSEVPQTVAEKKEFLLKERIAIWDVIAQCEIIGSSDSSIRNVIPNDLSHLLSQTSISRIYANGGKAHELYQKYSLEQTGRECVKLPSTSPANAAFKIDRLLEHWNDIRSYLHPEEQR